MHYLRLSVRLPLFVLYLFWCVLTAAWLRLADRWHRHPIDRAPYTHRYMVTLCRLLGFRVRVHGQPSDAAVLFVSNHISWSDIPVLASCAPLRFLSKQEVRSWPMVGWIAEQINTLFIKRGAGQSAQVREQIGAALSAGDRVLIFPEGTTGDGTRILPFHGRLIAAAADAQVPVQAITIGYIRDGRADPIAPFIGEDRFEQHLIRLLKHPAIEVDVIFHPPRDVHIDSVEALTQALQTETAQGLARILGEADAAQPVPAAEEPPIVPASESA